MLWDVLWDGVGELLDALAMEIAAVTGRWHGTPPARQADEQDEPADEDGQDTA